MTPNLLELAQTYTARSDAWTAAHAPVAEAHTTLVEAVKAAMLTLPAYAAAKANIEAGREAETAWRKAHRAAEAAKQIAEAPARAADEAIREALREAETAAKNIKHTETRREALADAREDAQTALAEADRARRAALTAANFEALDAEWRRLYQAYEAQRAEGHPVKFTLQEQIRALVDTLPLAEGDRSRLTQAALDTLHAP